LHSTPKDVLTSTRIDIRGDQTIESYKVDLSLFVLRTALSFTAGDCVIPKEQLVITAIRTSYILDSTAKLVSKLDGEAALDELSSVSEEYLRLSSEALKEVGVDCAAEVLLDIPKKILIKAKIVVNFVEWYPLTFIDMFRYSSVNPQISMVYTPNHKAVNWAKMESSWGNNDEAAIAALEEIMKIDPNYRETKEKLYALLVGKADRLQREGNREAAIAPLKRALEVKPGGGEAQQRLTTLSLRPAREGDLKLESFDLSIRSVRPGQRITATFTVLNTSSNPISIHGLWVSNGAVGACRANIGFQPVSDITLQAGERFVYRQESDQAVFQSCPPFSAAPAWLDPTRATVGGNSGGDPGWVDIQPTTRIGFEVLPQAGASQAAPAPAPVAKPSADPFNFAVRHDVARRKVSFSWRRPSNLRPSNNEVAYLVLSRVEGARPAPGMPPVSPVIGAGPNATSAEVDSSIFQGRVCFKLAAGSLESTWVCLIFP